MQHKHRVLSSFEVLTKLTNRRPPVLIPLLSPHRSRSLTRPRMTGMRLPQRAAAYPNVQFCFSCLLMNELTIHLQEWPP